MTRELSRLSSLVEDGQSPILAGGENRQSLIPTSPSGVRSIRR